MYASGQAFFVQSASHKATLTVGNRRGALVVRAVGNTFGNAFRVTTFGESHGGGVGCVVDGVPPRLEITRVGNCTNTRKNRTAVTNL